MKPFLDLNKANVNVSVVKLYVSLSFYRFYGIINLSVQVLKGNNRLNRENCLKKLKMKKKYNNKHGIFFK